MAKRPLNPNAKKALDQMKYEIANELGLKEDSNEGNRDLSSIPNIKFAGRVGGQMTKNLVRMAEEQMANKYK